MRVRIQHHNTIKTIWVRQIRNRETVHVFLLYDF